jgi:hypothetical protein
MLVAEFGADAMDFRQGSGKVALASPPHTRKNDEVGLIEPICDRLMRRCKRTN